MHTKLNIQTKRQQRALEALLAHPEGLLCKDLGSIIDALNPWQVIFGLREGGFRDMIVTKRQEVHNQDGNKSQIGRYILLSEYREVAERALNKAASNTDTNALEARDNNSKADHNKWGQS